MAEVEIRDKEGADFASVCARIEEIARQGEGVDGDLIALRANNVELFGAFGRRFLDVDFSNHAVWRILSMHYIRANDFDAAWACNQRHRAGVPNSEDAVSRAFRIALMRGDIASATALSNCEVLSSRFPFDQITNEKIRLASSTAAALPLPDIATLAAAVIAETDAAMGEARSATMLPGADPQLQRNLAMFSDSLSLLRAAKSIAILGNSSNLKGRGLGAEIDAHEVVIRINWPKISGFERDVGSRTSLVFCSEENLHGAVNRNGVLYHIQPYLSVNSIAIDCSRTRVTRFPLEDIVLPNTICLIPAEMRRRLKDIGYQFATTGLATILLVTMALGKSVSIYGFDFYRNTKNQYYYSPSGPDPHVTHELAFEAWMLRSFLRGLMPAAVSEP